MTLSRDYLAGSFPDAVFDRTTAGSLLTRRLTASIVILTKLLSLSLFPGKLIGGIACFTPRGFKLSLHFF